MLVLLLLLLRQRCGHYMLILTVHRVFVAGVAAVAAAIECDFNLNLLQQINRRWPVGCRMRSARMKMDARRTKRKREREKKYPMIIVIDYGFIGISIQPWHHWTTRTEWWSVSTVRHERESTLPPRWLRLHVTLRYKWMWKWKRSFSMKKKMAFGFFSRQYSLFPLYLFIAHTIAASAASAAAVATTILKQSVWHVLLMNAPTTIQFTRESVLMKTNK